MTKNQERALTALLSCPTMKAAAAAAGIDYRTIRRYMQNPEFIAEYRRITTELLTDARLRAQQAISPALETLSRICEDDQAKKMERIAAARSILEWSIRLTEMTDIVERIEALEENGNNQRTNHLTLGGSENE